MRTLLLDADILAYKIANAAQTVTQFPGCEPHIETAPWADVIGMIVSELAAVKDTLSADHLVACLSCPTAEGWRVQVLPTYKAHRDPKAKPILLGDVKRVLAKYCHSYERPTLEADDVMGILSTHPSIIKGERIIVSDDKDMGTIPGLWFKPGWVGGSGDSFVRTVTPEEADLWHLTQAISGDAVDGYAGCPGAGPTAAAAVLEGDAVWRSWQHVFKQGPRKGLAETRWGMSDGQHLTPWQRVVSLFEKHGLTEDDALVQARVARICRASDYDFKTKKVILWTPASYPCRPAEGTASTASTQPSPATA